MLSEKDEGGGGGGGGGGRIGEEEGRTKNQFPRLFLAYAVARKNKQMSDFNLGCLAVKIDPWFTGGWKILLMVDQRGYLKNKRC